MAGLGLRLADIRAEWESIKPGLETMRARFGPDWRVEDVYAACVSGQAFLYVGDCGFVVLQADRCKVTGEPLMLIWLAYADERGSIERYQAEVDRIARDGGFGRMVLWSRRKGWARVPGWTEVATVYERRLTHE